MPWRAPPSIRLRQAVGGSKQGRNPGWRQSRHGNIAGGLIDRDFRHHGGVSVIPLVQHAGDTTPGHHAGPCVPRLWRWTRIPVRGLRRGVQDSDQARIAQMAQPIINRIGRDRRRHFVHERFVGEGVLKPVGRSQWRGKEGRGDRVSEYLLAGHGPCAAGRVSGDDSVDIVCGSVAVVAEGPGRRRRSEDQRRCGESGQSAADDVAGGRRIRAIALGESRPRASRP